MRNLFLIFFCFSIQVFGQQYKFSVPLNAVKYSGYYRIALRPEIAGRCHENFRDLRIRNAQGQDVPYLIDHPKESTVLDNYVPFPITQQSLTKVKSVFIIDRIKASDKSSLVLRLANADVTKHIVVEGADDPRQWYIVQSSLTLNPSLLPGNDIRETTLDLPQTNYRYLRFSFNDSASGPLRVLGFGYYTSQKYYNKAFEIPSPVLSFPGATKNSVRLLFNQPYPIDQITLEIEYNGFYYRECSVNLPSSKSGNMGGFVGSSALASYFKLNEIQVYPNNYQELWLHIVNNDNPPLNIKSVHAWQKPVFAVANLEAGKSYIMYYGNDSANAPVYDLAYFQDKLSGDLPECTTGKPVANTIMGPKKKYSFWSSQLFLWSGIGFLLLILGLFSVKILREMGEKKAEN